MRPGASGHQQIRVTTPGLPIWENPNMSSLYIAGNGAGNRLGKHEPFFPITGRNLAHAHRDAGERAGIAAQLVLGEAELIRPTITQVAPITHVSVPYVQLALRLKVETRARVAAGELSFLQAVKANGLLAAWIASTPAERAALGSVVGVDEIWDCAIEPSV
jgi:hypothetical protein